MMLEWAAEQPTEITTIAVDLEYEPTNTNEDRGVQNLEFILQLGRCQCGLRTVCFLIQAPRRPLIARKCSSMLCNSLCFFYCLFALFHLSHVMSLYSDMKMFSLKCSGSHCWSVTGLQIFSKRPNF